MRHPALVGALIGTLLLVGIGAAASVNPLGAIVALGGMMAVLVLILPPPPPRD